ncbi:MAG: NADH-quinone oxidoreductase subunit N [Candidatus Synoicihabitans palmerolidicus]|nr:NADH-quinone oxidoreductase subunit N [Candidatus Synoicihabitans palmerolidicus]
MTTELLQQAAASNQWIAIAPELLVGCLALLLLIFEIVLPKARHDVIPTLAILGLLGIIGGFIVNYDTPFLDQETFNGLLKHTGTGQFMRLFFLFAATGVCVLGTVALKRQAMSKVEFFSITLVVTGAMMLLAQVNHFVMLFVALETVTVGFYILVSYTRTNPLSLEAGLKYLIMGALSSGLLLFGIVLLYGVAGNAAFAMHTANSMHFGELRAFLYENPDNLLASIGIVLVISGVAFKIGAVPFQIWISDVYQGAPTPVTAFLAIGSKAAGFALLLILVSVFDGYQSLVIKVLSVMAMATIIFGNVAALTQHNVKRLIGLSGVSHAGYLMIGVIAAISVPYAVGAICFYLLAYMLASSVVFGVMTHVSGDDDADQDLDHYTDLAKTHPFLGAVLGVGLGSLAGIPPLAGFMGKLLVFMAAFEAGLYPLLGVAILGVVLSIYYYFGWIKAAFFPQWRPPVFEGDDPIPEPARQAVGTSARVLLATAALATVLLGFYQGPLGQWLGLS